MFFVVGLRTRITCCTIKNKVACDYNFIAPHKPLFLFVSAVSSGIFVYSSVVLVFCGGIYSECLVENGLIRWWDCFYSVLV